MRALLHELSGNFQSLADIANAAPVEARLQMADVVFGPVVPDPEKVICIGLNYRDHAEETNHALPEAPNVFAKYSNTLIGDGQAIVIAAATSKVDYEAELAFIIGRRAKEVSEHEALSYVAGYTIFNDVSARDYQLRTSQWTLGKSFDTFGPIGPALVTKDEVPDPHALGIRLRIGDELLQDSNTSKMIFKVPALVAHLSSAMTLEPGDIVATGTPAGVGFTRTPPRFLQPGETVQVEIDSLGVLRNPVRRG
jgi:2-keto-4-pentenoate hydratase/2-oxohepta-3-ene-1,7-dioic acid hydratase in catechol pathway